ncbi:U3 snoRNP protein [Dispira parvispora]|uniref:U3 snoRNP protein n=1 Tax=Dispira parvispora TaxID=1520584 RepID=A0A9W8AG91_9FUNG|nr:U3 snoRNP protein [Dispira parvispora]
MAFLAKKATRSPIETSCCQQRAVFRWFAAMLTCVDSEDLAHYLKYIITPLHHVLNTWTVKDPAANSLKQLAQEVWEFALKQAGTTNFHVALSYVQESLDYSRGKNREMRQARKAQRKRPGDDDDEPTQVTNVDIVHSLKKRRGNNVVKSKRRLHNTR